MVANVLLGAAAGAVAYLVFSNPTLRRTAWRVTRVAVTTGLPGYLSREVTDAWRQSGRAA